jgi:hypothetical protein
MDGAAVAVVLIVVLMVAGFAFYVWYRGSSSGRGYTRAGMDPNLFPDNWEQTPEGHYSYQGDPSDITAGERDVDLPSVH